MNFEENTVRYAQISAALSRSRFRSRFRLGLKDRQYICDRGWETMRRHAAELVEERLAPAFIPNDGKQTPMRGHPVFIAQHATACCCRGCLEKWHKIPSGRADRRRAGIHRRHAAVLDAARNDLASARRQAVTAVFVQSVEKRRCFLAGPPSICACKRIFILLQ